MHPFYTDDTSVNTRDGICLLTVVFRFLRVEFLQIVNGHFHVKGVKTQPTVVHGLRSGSLENGLAALAGVIVPIAVGVASPVHHFGGIERARFFQSAYFVAQFLQDILLTGPLQAVIGVVQRCGRPAVHKILNKHGTVISVFQGQFKQASLNIAELPLFQTQVCHLIHPPSRSRRRNGPPACISGRSHLPGRSP